MYWDYSPMDLNKNKRKKMKHSPVSIHSLLLLTLATTSCVGQTGYAVRTEYDLCNPKTDITDPPRIYMEKPDVTTEIFVQWEMEPNTTSSQQCHMLLKSCSYCRIKVEIVEKSIYNPNCNEYWTDAAECTPGCFYMYLYDTYYKNVSITASYSSKVNGFQSQSSELNVQACVGIFNHKQNISLRLRFTAIEKLQEINGDPLTYLPRRTFMSPNFPNPYVSNSEIYRFKFQSASLTDYIAVSFDDWVVSPSSELLIENANLIKITGQNRRPYIISDGQSMSMQFNTGEFRSAGNYYAYLGFKAIATFYKDRSEIPEVQTDCGRMITDSGGVITLSKIADGSIRDCIWIIKKTSEYDGVYLKVLRYRYGQALSSLYENKLEIKGGLTSTTDPLLNVNANPYGGGEGFEASSDIGFYIRLKGSYLMEDSLVISYAMYLTDCTNFNEYFKCGNGHCIQAFLKCDTYDHCGYESDESMTLCNSGGGGSSSSSRSSDYPISIGVIIPMVVSVFLVIVMCLLIIFIRRCRRLNNGTFGNRPNGITQTNGRGRRRRRHNHNVQMSVTVSSGEHPPSYEEVIQNTPIGYLNMAFSWFHSDTNLTAPPSYEESIMPPSATPSQNAPPAAALGGSTGNLLLQGTATISTPQHQVSRATFMASLDPGAYVSSSSSSEYASEPENRLDLSSSSDTSDEHPSFLTNGINQNLSSRSSLDLNKDTNNFSVAQNAGKTVSNSTHKPVSEGGDMQVELDDLSLSKNKTPVTAAHPVENVRKNERNIRDNGHQVRRDRADFKETERKRDSQSKDNAMRWSRDTVNDPESGSEGLYIKRNHKKPVKSGTGRPSHHSENASKITESSRSQSCFDLSLGGAVGGPVPKYGKEEARTEDKRFSYAGYGDVSLKRDNLDPYCTGRGLVRDRPIENLNKYTAQSCDNLLQGYNPHVNREHHLIQENPIHTSSSCLDVSRDRKDKKIHHTSSLSLSKYSDTNRSLTPVPETGDSRPYSEPNRRAGLDKNRNPESYSAQLNPDLKLPHSDYEIRAATYQPEKSDQVSKGAIPKSKPADMLTLMPGPSIVLSNNNLRTTQYQEQERALSPKSNSSRTHHNAKDSTCADSNEHKKSLSSKKPGLTLTRDHHLFDNQRASRSPDAQLREGQLQSHEPIYDIARPLHDNVRSHSESVCPDRSVSQKETPEPIYQRPDHSRENSKLKPRNTFSTDESVHHSRGHEPIYQIPIQSRENNRINSRESFPSEGNFHSNQGPEIVNKKPYNQNRDQPRSSLANNRDMGENISRRQESIYQVPRQNSDPPRDYLAPSQLRPSQSAGNVGQKPTPAPRQAKMSASKAERDQPPVPRMRSLYGKGQPDNRSSTVYQSQQPGHSERPGRSTGDSSGNATRDQVEDTELKGRPDQVVLALDPIFQANENDVFV